MNTSPSHTRRPNCWIAILLLALGLGFAVPSLADTQRIVSAEQVPEGLPRADWEAIRNEYQKQRHAVVPDAAGQQARNPGQQWLARFDGRGFAVTPNNGAWSWGLELAGYGFAAQPRVIDGEARVTTQGQRVAYQWDEALEEWYVNDQRGLEHGFTLSARPTGRANAAEPLEFRLKVRGGLRPRVAAGGQEVSFVDAQGCAMLNYGGLKVWDADGKILSSRFAPPDTRHPSLITLLVEESGARYPLTIDPIAQQAYLKASNPGAVDTFGESVAISGDTVVVGAPAEDSSTTGVNSTPDENATSAGAAYVFVRSGTTWSQQAKLTAFDGASEDFFGCHVALSGDVALVGARLDDSASY
ncbi:MAG: FG-GAP repeat protein, partial [Verrucomicrobiales bacterium]|nr:FG-GAP repeat protein [Verrucomicrobiales bacterium]